MDKEKKPITVRTVASAGYAASKETAQPKDDRPNEQRNRVTKNH
jgi:hypothetical protein